MVYEAASKLSLADYAYKTISAAIVSGRLVSGDKLNEAKMSQQMQISRAPLREAFNRLESEGFIISLPYKGKVIADIVMEELKEVFYPMRLMIEDYACRKAKERLVEKNYTNLLENIEQMKIACNKNDNIGVVETDLEFHREIVKNTVSSSLYATWNSVSAKNCTYLVQVNAGLQSLYFIVDQHIEFYHTLRFGTPEEISRYLRVHFDV